MNKSSSHLPVSANPQLLLRPVVASLNIDFVPVGSGSMIVSWDGEGTRDDNFAPGVCFQVHRENVVESAEAVPASEDIQLLSDDISTVRSPWTRKRSL